MWPHHLPTWSEKCRYSFVGGFSCLPHSVTDKKSFNFYLLRSTVMECCNRSEVFWLPMFRGSLKQSLENRCDTNDLRPHPKVVDRACASLLTSKRLNQSCSFSTWSVTIGMKTRTLFILAMLMQHWSLSPTSAKSGSSLDKIWL